ncbi:MAG TPA: ABC transporter ATP-binding protein [Chloroflexia bacterium]|jgi:Fe-S cluster assembly ATP-binding protein|nr:ABC transporter ATP-binding protein [Chloroflexia bacterium]
MDTQTQTNQNADALVITDLHVAVEGKEILKGVNLTIRKGEVHAIMGPNGSGKSTLVNALMGHPRYEVTAGTAMFKGEDVLTLAPDERAHLGLFLAFQYPSAIPGVSVANFLRTALVSLHRDRRKISDEELLSGETPVAPAKTPAATSKVPAIKEFRKTLRDSLALLKMDESFATRYVNDGFSGGEKKRLEILQMSVLKPQIAMLDEPDSGLDIDAVRVVAEGVSALRGPNVGILIITHYQRILNYIKPDYVHILVDGQIVQSGGPELALELEQKGYEWLRTELGLPEEVLAGESEVHNERA